MRSLPLRKRSWPKANAGGGDISRKTKLLDEQKKGKAKMRERRRRPVPAQAGRNVGIPQEAFIAALRMGEE